VWQIAALAGLYPDGTLFVDSDERIRPGLEVLLVGWLS
jgi:hypothetical protein